MYDTHSKVFTELSYKAGLISGAFADPDKMLEHLKKLGGQVGEYMHHYHIDPVKLHAAAMGMVEGEFDEPQEKPKKLWRQ
jgi:hypothetical protein